MRKIVIMVLLAVFAIGCTAPEISSNELEEFGTKKDEVVSSQGDSQDYVLKEELDDTED